MLSAVMSLTPARANVTLTDNGNGTVTMNKGIVTKTCSKTGGDVSYFALNTLASTNLINPSQDYGLSLTHIGSGTNDYWVGVGRGGTGATYSVVTNNGKIVDIMIRNPLASGKTALYPNGLGDWADHHVMRAGEAGFMLPTSGGIGRTSQRPTIGRIVGRDDAVRYLIPRRTQMVR